MGNSPEDTSDENSYAEIDDSRTIPDVPINKGYLTKITAERARRERPDFIAPGATNEVQKALVGKPLEKVVRSAIHVMYSISRSVNRRDLFSLFI
jgi:hypothetical protein